MGKPYRNELEKLEATYQWALAAPIDEIKDFVRSVADLPLISVGSGGSYTSAAITTLLHQGLFGLAYSTTPLDMLSTDRMASKIAIAFFSAGGRNSDILDSFRMAAHFEPEQLLVLCTSIGSTLGLLAKKHSYVTVAEYDLPSGRDGFLATNSLLASAVMIIRSYSHIQPKLGSLPASLQSMIGDMDSFSDELHERIRRLLTKENIILLYGKWGKPAAIDFESKMTEAALGNAQLADFRNFAHGRHHWLDKHKSDTGILALVTPEDREIAEKTLKLIPNHIPRALLSSDHSDSIGTLELLVKVMHVISSFGESRRIDPGRPGVPPFGSRLYNLKTPFPLWRRMFIYGEYPLKKRALFRKISKQSPFSDDYEQSAIDALDSFLERMKKAKFTGVVLDYDGTLCDPIHRFDGPSKDIGKGIERLISHNILVGIATGRGSSVGNDLRRLLPKKWWSNVIIGYYNGSDIASLQDENHPIKVGEVDPVLSKFLSLIKDVIRDLEITVRPKQITIENFHDSRTKLKMLAYQHHVQAQGMGGLRILESSHSVDVIAPGVSKKNLVVSIEKLLENSGKVPCILKIGDKGQWPGNDFELLSDDFSLSVDIVSSDLNSCWNLAPLGHKGEQAVLDYFHTMKFVESGFTLELERLDQKHA